MDDNCTDTVITMLRLSLIFNELWENFLCNYQLFQHYFIAAEFLKHCKK